MDDFCIYRYFHIEMHSRAKCTTIATMSKQFPNKQTNSPQIILDLATPCKRTFSSMSELGPEVGASSAQVWLVMVII